MTKQPSETKKIEELKFRIGNGRQWLIDNPNSSHYKEGLDLYESLVDEIVKYGVKETDCWFPDEKTQDEIFLGKPAEQSKLIT